ncbi:hypothetical protein [Methylocystis echinoides]|uniref:Uncharacterized protein n=1 Tax=Methylocystis echinoides TaxID=29468 RepID=A0A9W6GSP7_9HYPH|nr:hypothetical protein [Methylocystis echinoides]GLI92309.1 hypothetical protein LMG27198_13010 [Methylocystis echinoides]
MERRAIQELARKARVYGPEYAEWALRRRRLERFAALLESTEGPVRLFSMMECYSKRERLALRLERSPLALAWQDAEFRRDGLRGDSVGEGVEFFNLSMREAHGLLCDCGYGGMAMFRTPLSHLVAQRARRLAAKRCWTEWRHLFADWADAIATRIGARASV